jgi:hypothetical protein
MQSILISNQVVVTIALKSWQKICKISCRYIAQKLLQLIISIRWKKISNVRDMRARFVWRMRHCRGGSLALEDSVPILRPLQVKPLIQLLHIILFVVYFMTRSVSWTIYHRMVGWLMNDELERKWTWPIRGTMPAFATRNLSEDIRHASRDSNRAPPECDSRALLPRHCVWCTTL